jgi:hypothetical protein
MPSLHYRDLAGAKTDMNKPFPGRGQDFPDTEPMLPRGEEADSDTQPMPLAGSAPAGHVLPDDLGLELAPMGGGDYDLMAEIRKDGRVCPQPTRWLEFYRVLQDAAQGAALPAPPLTGSAWASSSPASKRLCFSAQATWAVQNGCVVPVCEFLSNLPRTDWYFGD